MIRRFSVPAGELMAIPFPPAELAGLLGWVGGSGEIPVGSEDFTELMREGFDGLRQQLLAEELPRIDAAMAGVRAAYPHGAGGEAILDALRDVRDDIEGTAEDFRKLADDIHDFGGQVVAAKINGIIGLSWLAAELIWASTLGPAGPFAQRAAIMATRYFFRMIGLRLSAWIRGAVARAGVNTALRSTASRLLYEAIQEGLIEVAQGTGQEVVVQKVLIEEGYQEGYDWDALGTNALVSAGAGAAGGMSGHVLYRGITRLPLGENRWGGLARGMLVGSGAGLAGATAAWGLQGALTGNWEMDPRSLSGGVIGGAGPGAIYGWQGGSDFSGRPITADDYRRVRVGNVGTGDGAGVPGGQTGGSAGAGDSGRDAPGDDSRWAPRSTGEPGTPMRPGPADNGAGSDPNIVASRGGPIAGSETYQEGGGPGPAGEPRSAAAETTPHDSDAGRPGNVIEGEKHSETTRFATDAVESGGRETAGAGTSAAGAGDLGSAGGQATPSVDNAAGTRDGSGSDTTESGTERSTEPAGDSGTGGGEDRAGSPAGDTGASADDTERPAGDTGDPAGDTGSALGPAGRQPVDAVAAVVNTIAGRHPGAVVRAIGPVDAAGIDMRALAEVFEGNFVRAGTERGASPAQEKWRLKLVAQAEERRLVDIGRALARQAKQRARQHDEEAAAEVAELRRARAGLAAGRDPGTVIEETLANLARSRGIDTPGMSDAGRRAVFAEMLGEQIEEKQSARERARAAALAEGGRTAVEFAARGARERERLDRLADQRRGIPKNAWQRVSTADQLRESLEELGPGGTLVVVEEYGSADANGVNARPSALYLDGDTVMVDDGVSGGPVPFDPAERADIAHTFVAGIRGDGSPVGSAPAAPSGDDALPRAGSPEQVGDGTARYQADPQRPEELAAAAAGNPAELAEPGLSGQIAWPGTGGADIRTAAVGATIVEPGVARAATPLGEIVAWAGQVGIDVPATREDPGPDGLEQAVAAAFGTEFVRYGDPDSGFRDAYRELDQKLGHHNAAAVVFDRSRTNPDEPGDLRVQLVNNVRGTFLIQEIPAGKNRSGMSLSGAIPVDTWEFIDVRALIVPAAAGSTDTATPPVGTEMAADRDPLVQPAPEEALPDALRRHEYGRKMLELLDRFDISIVYRDSLYTGVSGEYVRDPESRALRRLRSTIALDAGLGVPDQIVELADRLIEAVESFDMSAVEVNTLTRPLRDFLRTVSQDVVSRLTAPLPAGVASARETFEAEAERAYHAAVATGVPEAVDLVEPYMWREDFGPRYHLWVSGTPDGIAALREQLTGFARGRGEFDQRATATGAVTLAIQFDDPVPLGQTLAAITEFRAAHPAGFLPEVPAGVQPVPDCPGVGFSAIPGADIRRRLRELELLQLPYGAGIADLLRSMDDIPNNHEQARARDRDVVRRARDLDLPATGGPEIVQALRDLRAVDADNRAEVDLGLREVYYRSRPRRVNGPQTIAAATHYALHRYLAETGPADRNFGDFQAMLREHLWFIGIDPARPHLELGDVVFGAAAADTLPPHRHSALAAGEQAEQVVARVRELYSDIDMELPAGAPGPERADRGLPQAFRGALHRFGTPGRDYRDAYTALGRELLDLGPRSTAVVAERADKVYLVRNIDGRLWTEEPEGRVRGTAYTFDTAARSVGEVRAILLDDTGCTMERGGAVQLAEAFANPAGHRDVIEREISRLRAEFDRRRAHWVPGVSKKFTERSFRELLDGDPHALVVALERVVRRDLGPRFTGDQRPLHLLRIARRLEIARLASDERSGLTVLPAASPEIPGIDRSDSAAPPGPDGRDSDTPVAQAVPSGFADIEELLRSRWEGLKYSTDRGRDYWRRLTKLFDDDGTSVIVALDHALTDGPVVPDATEFSPLIRSVLENGANGVFLHRGNASRFARTSTDGLVLHVTGGPVIGEDADGLPRADPNHKVLLGSAGSIVREAQRLDVDAVSVHVNVGARDNAEQQAEVAELARALSEADIPLIIMSYPRGPGISPDNVDHVLTAVSQAVLLGADIVKTSIPKWPEGVADSGGTSLGGTPDIAAMRAIVDSSPVPVLFAGGSNWTIPVEQLVEAVRVSGAAGLAVGRMVFRNPGNLSPGTAMRLVNDSLRREAPPRDTYPWARRGPVAGELETNSLDLDASRGPGTADPAVVRETNRCAWDLIDHIAERSGRADLGDPVPAGLGGALVSEVEQALGPGPAGKPARAVWIPELAALTPVLRNMVGAGRSRGMVSVFEPTLTPTVGGLMGHTYLLEWRTDGPDGIGFRRYDRQAAGVDPTAGVSGDPAISGATGRDFIPPGAGSGGRVLVVFLDEDGRVETPPLPENWSPRADTHDFPVGAGAAMPPASGDPGRQVRRVREEAEVARALYHDPEPAPLVGRSRPLAFDFPGPALRRLVTVARYEQTRLESYLAGNDEPATLWREASPDRHGALLAEVARQLRVTEAELRDGVRVAQLRRDMRDEPGAASPEQREFLQLDSVRAAEAELERWRTGAGQVAGLSRALAEARAHHVAGFDTRSELDMLENLAAVLDGQVGDWLRRSAQLERPSDPGTVAGEPIQPERFGLEPGVRRQSSARLAALEEAVARQRALMSDYLVEAISDDELAARVTSRNARGDLDTEPPRRFRDSAVAYLHASELLSLAGRAEAADLMFAQRTGLMDASLAVVEQLVAARPGPPGLGAAMQELRRRSATAGDSLPHSVADAAFERATEVLLAARRNWARAKQHAIDAWTELRRRYPGDADPDRLADLPFTQEEDARDSAGEERETLVDNAAAAADVFAVAQLLLDRLAAEVGNLERLAADRNALAGTIGRRSAGAGRRDDIANLDRDIAAGLDELIRIAGRPGTPGIAAEPAGAEDIAEPAGTGESGPAPEILARGATGGRTTLDTPSRWEGAVPVIGDGSTLPGPRTTGVPKICAVDATAFIAMLLGNDTLSIPSISPTTAGGRQLRDNGAHPVEFAANLQANWRLGGFADIREMRARAATGAVVAGAVDTDTGAHAFVLHKGADGDVWVHTLDAAGVRIDRRLAEWAPAPGRLYGIVFSSEVDVDGTPTYTPDHPIPEGDYPVGVAGYDFPGHRLGSETGGSASDPAERLRAAADPGDLKVPAGSDPSAGDRPARSDGFRVDIGSTPADARIVVGGAGPARREPLGLLRDDARLWPVGPGAAEVRQLLACHEIGRRALVVLAHAGVTVRFGTDPAADPQDLFDPGAMAVVIATAGRDQLGQAAAIVWAAEWVQTVLDGRVEVTPARIRAMDRDAYVESRVAAEAGAFARRAEFRRAMADAGYDVPAGPALHPIDSLLLQQVEQDYLRVADAGRPPPRAGQPSADGDRAAGIRALLGNRKFDDPDDPGGGLSRRAAAGAEWDVWQADRVPAGYRADVPSARQAAAVRLPGPETGSSDDLVGRTLSMVRPDFRKWLSGALEGNDIRVEVSIGVDGRAAGNRAWGGPATTYDPITRTVTLDPGANGVRRLRELIVAARLAEQMRDVDAASERATLPRDEYAGVMLDRFAEAYGSAFRWVVDGDLAGFEAELSDPLVKTYFDAFTAGRRRAEKVYGDWAEPGIHYRHLLAAAHRAGIRALREHLATGGPLIGDRSHGEYFAAAWDRARGIDSAAAEPPAVHRSPGDEPRTRHLHARRLADELDMLRALRDLGRFVPAGAAERVYAGAYDKAFARAARGRSDAAESPGQRAHLAGVQALRRYLARAGVAHAEIDMDVVRAAVDTDTTDWGHLGSGSNRPTTPERRDERTGPGETFAGPAVSLPPARYPAPGGRSRRWPWWFRRTADWSRTPPALPTPPWPDRNMYRVRYAGTDAGSVLLDDPNDAGDLYRPVVPDDRFDEIESVHAWIEADELIHPLTADPALTFAQRDIAWRLGELAKNAEVLAARLSESRVRSEVDPDSRAELLEVRHEFATRLGEILALTEENGIALGEPVKLGFGLERLARESAVLRPESDASIPADGAPRSAAATDLITGIGRLRSAIAWARAQLALLDRRFSEYRDHAAESGYPELAGVDITDVAALRTIADRHAPRDTEDRSVRPAKLLEFAEQRTAWTVREERLRRHAMELHLLAVERSRLSGADRRAGGDRTADLARIDRALAAGFYSDLDGLLATTEPVGDLAAYRPPDTHLDLGRADLLGVYRARDAAYTALGLAVPEGLPRPVARYTGTYAWRAPEVVGADWEPGGWTDPDALCERVRTTGDAVVATIGYRGLFRVSRVGSHVVTVFRDGTDVKVVDNGVTMDFREWVAAGQDTWLSSRIFGMVVHPDGSPGKPLVEGKSQAVQVLDYFPGSIGAGASVPDVRDVDGPDPADVAVADELLRRPLGTAADTRSCHADINRFRRELVQSAENRSPAATEQLLRKVVAAEDRIAHVLRSNGFGAVVPPDSAGERPDAAQRQVSEHGSTAGPASVVAARDRRRILLVSRWWAGAGIGGSATVNRELACALARMGHEVFVRSGSPVDEWTPPSGVTLIGPRSYDPDLPPEDQLDTDPDLLPDGIDTIISHKNSGGWAARFIRQVRYRDAQLVHFLHVDDATCEANRGEPRKGAAIKFLEGELSAEADVVAGVGPVLADLAGELAAKSGRAPVVHELLPGIEVVEHFEQPPLDGRPKVVLMGRLHSDRKGVHEAAQIARLVRERGGGIDLTLVGARPETVDRTQRMLSHIAGQEVEVVAYTTDPERKLELLRRAHLFIMPSRAESFGLVSTEALAAGLPVLAPDTSGFGRFLRDRFSDEISRRMVVPQDYAGPIPIETWADRIIEETADVPRLWEAAARARATLRDGDYSWDAAAAKMMNALPSTGKSAAAAYRDGPDPGEGATGRG